MKIGRLGFLKRLALFAGVGGAVAVCAKSVAAKPAIEKRELTIENLRIAFRDMEEAQRIEPQVLLVRPHFCDPDIARRIIESTRGGRR